MKQSTSPTILPFLSVPKKRPQRTVEKLLTRLRQQCEQQQFAAFLTACEQSFQPGQLELPEKVLVACWQAEALDSLGHPAEAVAALKDYERNDVMRACLHPFLRGLVDLRLATAYGFSGEVPYAITLAKRSLAVFAPENAIERKPLVARFEAVNSLALSYLPTAQALAGEAHLVLGRLYRTLGEAQLAYDYLTQGISALTAAGQPLLLAQGYLNRGVMWAEQGEVEVGIAELQQAKLVVGKEQLQKLPLLHGKLELNLDGMKGMRGDVRGARPHMETAVTCFEQAYHARLLALAQSNLAWILVSVGQWARAEQVLTQALPAMRGERFYSAEANALNTLGELQAMRGEFAAAQSYLAQGIETAQRTGHGYSEAEAWLTQGQVFMLAEDLPAAAQSFRQAQEISHKIASQREELVATLFLIEILCEQDESEAAHHALAAIRARVEATGNWNFLAHWRELQGRVLWAQGQFIEALTCLRQALTLWEMNGNMFRLARAYFQVGQLLRQSGEQEQSAPYLQQAEQIFQTLPCPPFLTRLQSLPTAPEQVPNKIAAAPDRRTLHNVALMGSLRLQAAQNHPELLQTELLRLLQENCGVNTVVVLAWQEPIWQPLNWRGCEEAQVKKIAQQVQQQTGKGREWPGFASAAATKILPFGTAHQRLVLCLERPLPREQQVVLASWLETITQALELHAYQKQTRTTELFRPALVGGIPDILSFPLPGMVYKSEAMGQVAAQIHKLRGSRITVLITGETGTGKELIAHAIHQLSDRAEQPFLAVNCAALPAELMEAELFGYKKGAFTGAKADYKGLIREAAGGTLFLDEVGELPKSLQPKLLRFLQEHEVRGLGESQPQIVDVRIIAATNCNLEVMVAKQEFREDLYYRINVMQVNLPALRARKEEIPLFLTHYLKRYRAEFNKPTCEFSPAAWQLLQDYDWPGNVRQLAHEVQRAVALAPEDEPIPPELLSEAIRPGGKSVGQVTPLPAHQSRRSSARQPQQTLAEAVAELEREVIQEVFTRHGRNLSATAKELGLTRFTLRQKLEKYRTQDNETTKRTKNTKRKRERETEGKREGARER